MWSAIGSASQAGTGLASTGIQYKLNEKLMKQQHDFARFMRGTQYQAAVRDLEKAGLNPVLAAFGGGSAGHAGASASVSAPQLEAMKGAIAGEQLGLTVAQRKKTQGEARSADAKAAVDEQYTEWATGEGYKTWLGQQKAPSTTRAMGGFAQQLWDKYNYYREHPSQAWEDWKNYTTGPFSKELDAIGEAAKKASQRGKDLFYDLRDELNKNNPNYRSTK